MLDKSVANKIEQNLGMHESAVIHRGSPRKGRHGHRRSGMTALRFRSDAYST